MAVADSSGIPPDILQFLDEVIHSVEQLEVLLLLQKDGERWWAAEEVAAALRASHTSIQQRLDDLTERGLAESHPDGRTHFRARFDDANVDRTLRSLAEVYRDRRVAVIDRIFCKPKASLLGFANAFRIKKEPPS